MRLSWQEIRNRAIEFSERFADAHYEMGETQGFYIAFFDVFGIDYRRVLRFEEKVELIQQGKRGRIDAFWPGMLLVEQKSEGRDLAKAKTQAFDYFEGLRDRDLPKYVLTCDFQTFELHDLKERETYSFALADLHKNVELFSFMLGVERRYYGEQDEVSIKAAEKLGKIHDALEAKNYRGGDLERLMVRLLFCLFADDTGIFDDKDDFRFLIEEHADEDGGNIGRLLNELFEVLDTPNEERPTGWSAEFTKFPYVNGDLFKGHVRTAPFDAKILDDLLECCAFDWGAVSPAIFGSLFQSVMDREERRKKGAHYTTEPNIMKVIGPLFLDDLREELDRLKAHRGTQKRAQLLQFQEKLASLNFFDPACGCGNFLVVTYRELRRMEQEALEQVYTSGQREMFEVEELSQVKLNQFYGIELEEFPAHIAEVAMWMTEHLANIELGRTFGKVFADIPLREGAHIVHGDALETGWDEVLPHQDCFAVMGNPPFAGKKEQSPKQKAQVRRVFTGIKGAGEVDFVACWFHLAKAYVRKTSIRVGFVSTNSITQGEQVKPVWQPFVDQTGFRIPFAHRTFEWGSDARGKAHVHVVVIGITFASGEKATLFDYENQRDPAIRIPANNINPYLVDGPNLIVEKASAPLSARQIIRKGSEATDWGFLTLSEGEATELRENPAIPDSWIKPFWGGDELINREARYCLWLKGVSPAMLRNARPVMDRIRSVKEKRLASTKPRTRSIAELSHLFGEDRQPSGDYLFIPKVSSQRRRYVPIAFVSNDIIVSGSAQFISDASLCTFGVVTSAIHMAWMKAVGGRTKSDFQYTPTMVYNTFPWPSYTDVQEDHIENLAQTVLDTRDNYPDSSLADLYDPDTMPPDLRKAHKALDKAVDRLYRKKPFESDRERVEHLFGLYEKLVNPLADAGKQNKRVERNVQRRKKL